MTSVTRRAKGEIVEALRSAGVVGCGGAGFPTYAKFSGDSPDHFIINAAECEPLLHSDRYAIRHRAREIASAVAEIAEAIGARETTIALKASYREEIASLEEAIEAVGADVKLHLMKGFYPAGDEQTMLYEVTGRVVPPGGIPLDVSCAVSNVATMLAARDAIDGKPFTRRYVTVGGEVEKNVVVEAPIGTPLESCVDAAGGPKLADFCVLIGGPMMGRVVSKEEFRGMYVTKTTSGIIVLPRPNRLEAVQRMSDRQMSTRARAACIRCSMCTDLCPRNLLGHPIEPHRIMRALALSGGIEDLPLSEASVRRAALCCECGICELVACPMHLQPRRINAELKKILARAGIRYEKGADQREPSLLRDSRKVPTMRAAARAGVLRYSVDRVDELVEIAPGRVSIKLAQHIGAPCEPLVRQGDVVSAGQLIAASPEDKLGSALHASIAGTVESADGDTIVITAEGGVRS